MNLQFSGQRVLITGGSSEIGIALGKLLCSERLFPILTCKDQEGEDKINHALEGTGEYETVFFDFKDPQCVDNIFSNTQPVVDYLVDLAQTDYETLVASSSCEKIDQYYQDNITARAHLVRAASRSMLKKKFGRLIFISSAAVNRPASGQGFYTSAKLACEALYKNCGLELVSRGITSLILRPGYIDAGRGKTFLEKYGQKLEQQTNSPVIIGIEDLCSSILFFLSNSAMGFNGTAITMDNGLSSGK